MKLNQTQQQISDSLTNGFVERGVTGTEAMMPQFIYNREGDSMLLHIERELDNCSSFIFAIAFLTEGALTTLKVKLADLAEAGIHGRILTSDYLNFNAPKAFQELQKLKNVEVRLAEMHNFHAKGYIFEHEADHYQSAIIGSSNLTEKALTDNYEWNVKFTSYQNGTVTKQLVDAVEDAWQKATPLTADWINNYQQQYQPLVQPQIAEATATYTAITPNAMQQEALARLAEVRAQSEEKALVISATGTGKTYLAAFDVANYKPRKFLYIVHREQILDKSIASFKKVLGEPDAAFGKLSGNQKNTSAKYLFATIQTIAKDDWLQQFDPGEFDYILVDEAHRAGSPTYQKVLAYFTPNFLLGMTATPERSDAFNLYELFDYNIAYEIRLQKALDEDMLCPFHYIGITDYERDGEISDDTSQLKWLVSEERVTYILQQTDYYGYSGAALQGLIFCSRTEEAQALAAALTAKGHPSKALTGATPQVQRDAIVRELEHKQIEYIITVDVFNEGIDIPCVNQVVMLRNTQSSIVFIQQLGRGLRKFKNKDYVTVIDFIGNYKNNYLIPIALTGDKSRNKDSARDDLELRQISGVSTVNFSKIAKERIYQSINDTSLNTLRQLRDDYQDLKGRLGRVPLLADFQEFGTVDCTVFADKYQNYYQFLVKMKEDMHLTIDEERVLSFVSIELMNGKRSVELLLLQQLLELEGYIGQVRFEEFLTAQQVFHDQTVMNSVARVFSLAFFTKANQAKYGNQPIVEIVDNQYRFNAIIRTHLAENGDFKRLFMDAIKAGLLRSKRYDQTQQLMLYKRYTRKDVCRLLGWQTDSSSTLYGYRIKEGTCPIFVTYAKADDVDANINYEDQFINTSTFQWYTRHPAKLDSKEIVQILDKRTTLKLFIKKNDDEGSGFYYFGDVTVQDAQQETFQVKDGKTEPIVKFQLGLVDAAQFDKYLLFEK
ncbi:DUF3427 domain-containing protein [Loigolactobacillus bifermentans]|uniref:Superfamily II DNA RNA helicase n=1 Tax=Loigolactobacillus bifermentans DSM 20003 TaxID=1423726 RepID=A0A0R1GMI0_9LACO|nr:DEAD/DEAH box helicase [Loigolactobacillus bifermentans]KRK34969.1 superfamily II DNA RNA helicase [Loigolactobacillus bifermentans DSM 20003]QGG61334.1 DUF3427 domain-containing protein [Loigolactobacillus bifermentans]